VVVATDGADVLALLGPEDFVAKYQHTQVREVAKSTVRGRYVVQAFSG
jgi:hypothetical protein